MGLQVKTHGTAKSTVDQLSYIVDNYASPDSFMADGGSHFRNELVDEFCKENRIHHITTPAYAPWCNRLIEGLNKLLLGRLRRLCVPDLDTAVDENEPYNAEDLPTKWPLFFGEAIRPTTGRTPRELLFALALTPDHVSSPEDVLPTPDESQIHTTLDSTLPTSIENIEHNTALAERLRTSAHQLQFETAAHQKALWDEHTPAVAFEVGDLVQWYDSAKDGNCKTVNKLAPRWSKPHIIAGKSLNSYSLSHINGTTIPGQFASYRLHKYTPLRGSDLHQGLPTTETLEDTSLGDDLMEMEDRMRDDSHSPYGKVEPLDRSAD